MNTSEDTKTVHYCCACGKNSRHNKNLSFFRIPKDEPRFSKWKTSIQSEKIESHNAQYCYDHYRVCSLHFENQMFSSMQKNRLKKDAVPTLHFKEKQKQQTSSMKDEMTFTHAMGEPIPSTSSSALSEKRKISYDQHTPSGTPSTEEIAETPITSKNVEAISEETQTSKHLSCGTPRKVELRKTIKGLKRKLKSSPSGRRVDPEITLEDVVQFVKEHFSPNLANFLKTQILLSTKSPKGSRYTNEFKQFALTIHFLGPKVYKFLSKTFRLPSRSTLQRITAKWEIGPGFGPFLFEALKIKLSFLAENERDCILCLDEMSIKSHLYYNISRDEIIGFHQTTKQKTFQPAKNVLVLMARGIHTNWKQPLAFFFLNSSCPVNDLKDITYEALTRLKSVGLNVLSLISDHGSNFNRLLKELNVTVEQPYFIHDNSKIFYMIDVPHLLKSTKNNFLKYILEFEGGLINRQYLKDFYKSDKQQKFPLAPKLTDAHIFPNNFQKMKVKYAAQVFSASVAAALNAYVSFQKLPPAAMKTAEFVEKIDKLFDIFNSSKFSNAKAFNRPFMGTETQIKFLKDMSTFFEKLIVWEGEKNVTNRMKFTFGWRLSIAAFLGLWDVVKARGIRRIHTRRLNQDCLENFFGKIRQQSGNCRNPTPIQFQRAFRKMFALNYLDNSEGSNCLDEFDTILATITPETIQRCQILIPKQSILNSLRVETNDYKELNIEKKNGFVYVAGYFMKKALDKHSCPSCLTYGKEQTELSQSTVYSHFRAYGNAQNDTFGNLQMPGESFIFYLHSMETTFCEMFPRLAVHENCGKQIKNSLMKIEFTKPCQEFPVEYLVSLFARVRIYYTLKFLNQDIKTNLHKPNHKLTILKHL